MGRFSLGFKAGACAGGERCLVALPSSSSTLIKPYGCKTGVWKGSAVLGLEVRRFVFGLQSSACRFLLLRQLASHFLPLLSCFAKRLMHQGMLGSLLSSGTGLSKVLLVLLISQSYQANFLK